MKKIIYIMLITITLSTYLFAEQKYDLNEDTIRFRIIPNSNSVEDQNLKQRIIEDLQGNIFNLIQDSKSPEETEKIINENKPLIENIIKKYNIDYKINYGYNYFPEKTYKGIKYKEGDYKSLVIYLGESKGNNWWCVMYPPLCNIDYTSNNSENIEYKLYIEELTK